MQPRFKPLGLFLIVSAAAASATAQSDVDPTNKRSWQENCGWMNWRDANSTTQGIRDRRTFFSGFVWCENTGWVHFGDGGPTNGVAYANTSSADFGINVSPTGNLSGFAWGENTGWINFSGGALASPAQPARVDSLTSRLRGFAWGENIGWISLDAVDTGKFPAFACYANCDGSTAAPVLNVNDFVCFNNKFAAGDPAANCDRSILPPVLNVNDFTCFLNAYAAGCP